MLNLATPSPFTSMQRSFTTTPDGLRQRAATADDVGGAAQGSLPTARTPAWNRSNSAPIGDVQRRLSSLRNSLKMEDPRLPGFYLVKFAVSTTATYLAIQLLMTFAEVLLPFIFAVLCVIVLEPLKRFVSRVLQRLAAKIFRCLDWKFCLEAGPGGDASPRQGAYGQLSPEPPITTDDDVGNAMVEPDFVPVPAVKKLILVASIVFCIVLTGRVLWITAKVFLRACYAISGNMEFYKEGSARLKVWFVSGMSHLHLESSNQGDIVDDLLAEVENIGSIVTKNVLYTAAQGVVTFIFLIYMLWSPIRVDDNTLTRDAFRSTGRYIKVKCLTSAITGLSVGIVLAVVGLDLPAAFGLLSFIANFLPGIGSFVASILPCILAIMDVRRTPAEVLLAFLGQIVVHICIDFVLEPVFFGISIEIHSVVVLLGVYFFYQVWGVPGMLLSVPLLAVLRIMMKSMKEGRNTSGGDDRDTIVLLDSILEGRWMTSIDEYDGYGDIELAAVSNYQPDRLGGLSPVLDKSLSSSDSDLIPENSTDYWQAMCGCTLVTQVTAFYASNGLLLDAGGLAAVLFITLML
mmetsp:Transcript_109846/g.295493  ORF Transcript_109846/g.295493 Transcript_109846/m.295493 type:complete len:574 (+) Transcript_109846:64-1785(+)